MELPRTVKKDEGGRMKDEILDLRTRTKTFAIRIIKLYSALPKTTEAQVIGKQVLRSGTSVGAHYREASRSRSDAEFISKMEVALQELDETGYWFELLIGAEIIPTPRLSELIKEVDELTAIIVTMVKKVKQRSNK
jgi:four helix bundle protein